MNQIIKGWHLYNKEMCYDMCKIYQTLADNTHVYHILHYLGVVDKETTKICEEDYIEFEMNNQMSGKNKKFCKAVGVVKWCSGAPSVADWKTNKRILEKDPSTYNEEPGFYVDIIYNERGYRFKDWSYLAGCKVLGNSFENPEIGEKYKKLEEMKQK